MLKIIHVSDKCFLLMKLNSIKEVTIITIQQWKYYM